MREIIDRGVRLPLLKKPAAKRPIVRLKNVTKISLPLGIAGSYTLLVEVGDPVTIGMALGTRDDMPLCSVDGLFEGVRTARHPIFGEMDFAVVGAVSSTTPTPAPMPKSPEDMTPDDLLAVIDAARVMDELDGTPLIDKLRDWKEQGCDLVIGDAVEPESYASSGWALLRHYAYEIYQGLQWIQQAIGAHGSLIAIQNKFKHIQTLKDRVGENHVYGARRLFPVDRFAPESADGLRQLRVGVQAAYAVYRAVSYGIPHTETVLTVAGDAVDFSTNLQVPIGASVDDILKRCGLVAEPDAMVFGDVMTGIAIDSAEHAVYAGVTCLLCVTEPKIKPRPCIGCGRCAAACHQNLLPYEIARELENLHYEQLPRLRAERCDGCGACSFVCPSARDVVSAVLEAGHIHGDVVFQVGGDDDA